ncbi:hypothetical protein CCHR01_03223 [Colletotrichum chrysophilum]|uniref:Uncharacterized protein n=1 Tax=Colletotrichum chrysophilum TaxID=1836956 RepID=A0AAD9AWV9_9PEZI|nr:hypothetical protein CCHR01_03223 [Colletotrichum chrysophilum]
MASTGCGTLCAKYPGQRRTRYGVVSVRLGFADGCPAPIVVRITSRVPATLCSRSHVETNRHAVAGLCFGIMKHSGCQERFGWDPAQGER